MQTDVRFPPVLWWLIAFLTLGVLVWLLRGMIAPFLFAAALAYLLHPLASRIAGWGAPRGVAALGLILLALALLAGLLLVVVPPLLSEARSLLDRAPELLEQAEERIRGWLDGSGLPEGAVTDRLPDAESLGGTIAEQGAAIIAPVGRGVQGVIGFLLNFVLAPVVAFYLLRDWPRFIAAIDDHLPRRHLPAIRSLAREVDATVHGFLRGEGLVVLIQSAYYATALSLIGLQYGLFVGVLSGVLTFIPFIGTIVAATLTFALAFQQFWGEWWMIGAVIAVFAVAQLVEGYVLVPNLVGNRVGLHPVWLIFAVLAFGALFGLPGTVIAVPVAAALGVLVRAASRRWRRSRAYLLPPGPDRMPMPPPTPEPPAHRGAEKAV
ncbi:MAG: AI-2E family transporter [Gemmobacter sp.]